MRQKMKFGGGLFPPPQGNFPQSYPGIGFGGGGGPQGLILPSFELPFADLGNGVVSTVEIRVGMTPTFVRATAGWTRKSDLSWVGVASGSPRSYWTRLGVYAGYLVEPQRQNRCLHSRDLTNAAWVAVNVTTAKTQTGIDGVVNSCSLLTASLDAGTLLQTVVSASATRSYSAHIKRSVGTGTLEMTVDGVTWTAVTSSVGVGVFGLCQITQAAVTNPIMGFRIGTAGDAFVIDMCQEETGAKASTPIPTTVAAVTRDADNLRYTLGASFNAVEGSLAAAITDISGNATVGRAALSLDDGTTNERIFTLIATSRRMQFTTVDGGATQAQVSPADTITADVPFKVSTSYKLNDFTGYLSGQAGTPDTAGTLPTVTTLVVGGLITTPTNLLEGCIKDLRYYNRRLSNSQLQALTA